MAPNSRLSTIVGHARATRNRDDGFGSGCKYP